MSKKMYVVQARTGCEKSVAKALAAGIEQKGLVDAFGEILVPVETVQELKGGKAKVSERRIYPGYVFVEMDLQDDTWHLVTKTKNVVGFVGGSGTKAPPMLPKDVENLRKRMTETAEKPAPKTEYTVGEMVRVIEGAFKDFEGSISNFKPDKQKLTVLLKVFGRETPVDLVYNQVEKMV